jgi:hypothetical protein
MVTLASVVAESDNRTGGRATAPLSKAIYLDITRTISSTLQE